METSVYRAGTVKEFPLWDLKSSNLVDRNPELVHKQQLSKGSWAFVHVFVYWRKGDGRKRGWEVSVGTSTMHVPEGGPRLCQGS